MRELSFTEIINNAKKRYQEEIINNHITTRKEYLYNEFSRIVIEELSKSFTSKEYEIFTIKSGNARLFISEMKATKII